MHIVAISEIDLGSHKAHAINVVKTAGGFLRLGHTVTLLCRVPQGPAAIAPHLASYGEPGLRILAEPHSRAPAANAPARFGRWAADTARAINADLVYARNFLAPIATAAIGIPTVVETHAHIDAVNPLLDQTLGATRTSNLAVATISHRLRDHYIQRGSDPNRTHIIPDGVDLDLFSPRPAASPFDTPAPNLLYSGHLYDYKGIPTILDAAAIRPSLHLHLLGGTPQDQSRVRAIVVDRALANVTLHEPVPHAAVPRYLWAADALLLPPNATDPSAAWTSPVKLAEYLASTRPIVATRIPGLLDWVDAPAVTWCAPDDPQDLLRAADLCLSETPAARAARTAAASAKAREFSYANRARRLIDAALHAHHTAAAEIAA